MPLDSWDGWPIAAFPTIPFLSSRPPIYPSKEQTNRIPLDVLLNYLQFILSLGEHNTQLANWLGSPYHTLPFIAGSHQHLAGGNPHGSLQGLSTKDEEETGHMSSKTLLSCSPSLRDGDITSPFE